MKAYRLHERAEARLRVHSGISLEERIRRYLDAIPPAISGQGGHRQTFFAARALVHGFALRPSEAWPYLEKYNRRCQPPWTRKELEHKLQSALTWRPANGQRSRGYLRG